MQDCAENLLEQYRTTWPRKRKAEHAKTHMPRSTNLTLAETLDAAGKAASISDANFSQEQ